MSLRPAIGPIPKPTPRQRDRKRLRVKYRGIPQPVKQRMLERWGSTCLWCQELGGTLDPHHVLRRSQGGKDHEDNLRPLHRKCHRFVHEHPAEAKARGFLA